MAKYRYVRITKILNNNAVEVKDGEETRIVLGTGAGFHHHVGDYIELGDAYKVYALVNNGVRTRFETLLNEIPYDCFELTQAIISMAEAELKTTFNESLLLSLADHINFAAQNYLRGGRGAGFDNEEIKRLYQDEYRIALRALDMVNAHYGIELDRKEAISIAFLLVGAEYHIGRDTIELIQKGIDDIVGIVSGALGDDVENDPVKYARLIIHLKFFLQAVINGEPEEGIDLTSVSIASGGETNEKIASILGDIEAYVRENYDYQISDSERFYLLIHIVRIM